MIDCVYVAASTHDSRFTRICVASIRCFYSEIPIRLLIGGRVPLGLIEELYNIWGVEVAAVPPGHYGWGFVKLEPLFQKCPERFLVLDSDTVFLGPVLTSIAKYGTPFVVDDERQSDADTCRLYYNWEKLRTICPVASRPQFVFNSGQWIGTSNLIRREDFSPWVNWATPRTLRHPEIFRQGEQGVLNFVLNQRVCINQAFVTRCRMMRWPGYDLSDIKLAEVSRGVNSPYRKIVHWAGLKAARLETLSRGDLLVHFERFYYNRHGGGEPLRVSRAIGYALKFLGREYVTKVRQRLQRRAA